MNGVNENHTIGDLIAIFGFTTHHLAKYRISFYTQYYNLIYHTHTHTSYPVSRNTQTNNNVARSLIPHLTSPFT